MPKGSAIISALFIMILVSIAATAMSLKLQIDIKRTTLIKNTSQMLLSAQNATMHAMSVLVKSHIDKKHPTAFQSIMSHSDQIETDTHIIDLQGLFNLNNLKDKKYTRTLAQLLLVTTPKINVGKAIAISEATAHWIKPLSVQSSKNNLDKAYENKHYSAPHMPMISPSEFRLVQDVNQTIFNQIQPYITTLPSNTPININTAPLSVLRVIGAGLSENGAKSIIKARGKEGFKSNKEFNQSDIAKKLQLRIDKKLLSLESTYYLIAVKATQGDDTITLFSRINLIRRKKSLDATILMQGINTR